jgi:asparaginyl-tRNA synthetase
MIEPEIAFADYNEGMDVGEEQIKFVVNKVLTKAQDELAFLESFYDKKIVENLEKIVNKDFVRITYREALQNLKDSKVDFEEMNFEFGLDLSTEHERYLSEVLYDGPVYVYDYPTVIKSFYMYRNDDDTCRGFDLLVPGVGELIGGSQRIETEKELIESANQKGSSIEDLE